VPPEAGRLVINWEVKLAAVAWRHAAKQNVKSVLEKHVLRVAPRAHARKRFNLRALNMDQESSRTRCGGATGNHSIQLMLDQERHRGAKNCLRQRG
jgi:hypothetical protein